MKLKHLESALSSIPTAMFPEPKVTLEQYPTSANLTASIMLSAMQNGDVGPNLSALDLGCGTGMLAIGCALVGCDHVIAVDCDQDAIEVAQANVEEMELEDTTDFLLAQVNYIGGATNSSTGSSSQDHITEQSRTRGAGRGGGGGTGKSTNRGKHRGRGKGGGRHGTSTGSDQHQPSPVSVLATAANDGIPLRSNCVDTVFTNPPFGTKNNAGADVQFLYTATRLARRAVYSFHKTSTREYLLKKIQNEWGLQGQVVAEMKFEIPNMYKFHKKKSVDIDVDLIRVCVATKVDSKESLLENHTLRTD